MLPEPLVHPPPTTARGGLSAARPRSDGMVERMPCDQMLRWTHSASKSASASSVPIRARPTAWLSARPNRRKRLRCNHFGQDCRFPSEQPSRRPRNGARADTNSRGPSEPFLYVGGLPESAQLPRPTWTATSSRLHTISPTRCSSTTTRPDAELSYYPGTEEAHTNPTRERGECLRALAGASG